MPLNPSRTADKIHFLVDTLRAMASEKIMQVSLEVEDLTPLLYREARRQGVLNFGGNDAGFQAKLMLASEDLLRMLEKVVKTLSTSQSARLLGVSVPHELLQDAQELIRRVKPGL